VQVSTVTLLLLALAAKVYQMVDAMAPQGAGSPVSVVAPTVLLVSVNGQLAMLMALAQLSFEGATDGADEKIGGSLLIFGICFTSDLLASCPLAPMVWLLASCPLAPHVVWLLA